MRTLPEDSMVAPATRLAARCGRWTPQPVAAPAAEQLSGTRDNALHYCEHQQLQDGVAGASRVAERFCPLLLLAARKQMLSGGHPGTT